MFNATVYVTTSDEAELAVSQMIYHRCGLSTQYNETEYNDDGTATHEYSVEYHDDDDIKGLCGLLSNEGDVIKFRIEP